MVTATDIITYIGIPLAVLGVTPILWNAGKSWLIRRYLCKVIPNFVRRQFFTIIMDPASGTVSVKVEQLYINARSFFGYDPVSLNPLPEPTDVFSVRPSNVTESELEAGETAQKSWLFRQGLRHKDRRPNATVLSHVNIDDVRCPAVASWMPLVTAGMMPFSYHRTNDNRYTVDSDLRCQNTPLICEWPTFVYLALALGATSWELSERVREIQLGRRLQNSAAADLHGFNAALLMRIVLSEAGRIIASLSSGEKKFSLRRMLAWENIMLVKASNKWTCVPIPSYELFPASNIPSNDLCPFSNIHDFSLDGLVIRGVRYGNNMLEYYFPHRREIYRLKDSSNPTSTQYFRSWNPETFEDALCWTIYAESIYDEFEEILPVSQPFLILQEHSIVQLGRWDPDRRRQLLQQIFAQESLVNEILDILNSSCDEQIYFGTHTTKHPANLTVVSDADRIRNVLQSEKARRDNYLQGIGDYITVRKGRPFDEALIGNRVIWKHIKGNPEFISLRNNFYELCKGLRSHLLEGPRGQNNFPSEEAKFVAHLLLAFSITKSWIREDWYVHCENVEDDGRVHYLVLQNGLKNLLKQGQGEPYGMGVVII